MKVFFQRMDIREYVSAIKIIKFLLFSTWKREENEKKSYVPAWERWREKG